MNEIKIEKYFEGRPMSCKVLADQIDANPIIPLSWGISNVKKIQDKDTEHAMMFDVFGRHFTGTIVIWLNFLDYYNIDFYKEDGFETIENVSAFNLVEIIDEKVEK